MVVSLNYVRVCVYIRIYDYVLCADIVSLIRHLCE